MTRTEFLSGKYFTLKNQGETFHYSEAITGGEIVDSNNTIYQTVEEVQQRRVICIDQKGIESIIPFSYMK